MLQHLLGALVSELPAMTMIEEASRDVVDKIRHEVQEIGKGVRQDTCRDIWWRKIYMRTAL